MKPYNAVWIIQNTIFLKRTHITAVTLNPLTVICLKHAKNLAMACLKQILCNQVSALTIIHHNIWMIFKLLHSSLNKHIRNMEFLKLFIKCNMTTVNLTLTWFNNQTFYIL